MTEDNCNHNKPELHKIVACHKALKRWKELDIILWSNNFSWFNMEMWRDTEKVKLKLEEELQKEIDKI